MRVRRCAGPPPQAFLLRAVAGYVTRILGIFGIAGSDGIGLGRDGDGAGAVAGEGAEPLLSAIAGFRTDVRSLAVAALREADNAAAVKALLKSLLAVSDRCVCARCL